MSRNDSKINHCRRLSLAPPVSLVQDNKDSTCRRLSIVPQDSQPLEKESLQLKSKTRRRVLFVIEPIIIGLIVFPLVVLFWQCGWNAVSILLSSISGSAPVEALQESRRLISDAVSSKFPDKKYFSELGKQFSTKSPHKLQSQHKNEKGLSRPTYPPIEDHDPSMSNLEVEYYSFQSLIISYVLVQICLLCLYLSQDYLYDFLKGQNYIFKMILLKCHIFLLASIYIGQWEMIWTCWDQYGPQEWSFELLLSLIFLFGLIAFLGHLSDLICAPFLVSYDSIEYCLKFDCSLLTTPQMKQWKIHLINFILYEIIISNVTIVIWRGFYHLLDMRIYPDDWTRSAWVCLLIGYALYFPLMYSQSYLEDFKLHQEMWTFISMNFPEFSRNLRHFLAFCSCLFLWRGFWLLYDLYIDIFESYYQTCLVFYVVSFLLLALMQTASSTNGPLSPMRDESCSFPLYSSCYLSSVERLKVNR